MNHKKTQFILLLRHGRTGLSHNQKVNEVADAFGQILRLGQEPYKIDIGQTWYAPSAQAQMTVKILSEDKSHPPLGEVLPNENLNPNNFGIFGENARIEKMYGEIRCRLKDFSRQGGSKNAILIIGHQPQLGHLAYKLLADPTPIDSSEMICIVQHASRLHQYIMRRQLFWTLTPSSEDALKDLYEKIKSKMEIVKLLGAVIVAVLGWVLSAFLDPSKLNPASLHPIQRYALVMSTSLLLCSLGLYLTTIYAYDRFLMPVRFWGEKSLRKVKPQWLVWRPPSSAIWVVYQNMIRIWEWRLRPATIAVVVGLALLALATLFRYLKTLLPKWVVNFFSSLFSKDYFTQCLPEWVFNLLADWSTIISLGSLLSCFVFCWYRSRPKLGTQD